MTRVATVLSIPALLLAFGLATGTASAQVVVAVSVDSPVTSLTRSEIADIYLGRLTRLPDGSPILPVDQAERTVAHGEFYSSYLGRSPAQIKAHWSRLIFTGRGQPPRSVRGGEDVAAVIAGDARAIGYLDAALVDDRLRVVRVE